MPYADAAKRQEVQQNRRKTPEWATSVPFRCGSVPHVALTYLKMVNRPVGTGDLRALSDRMRDARAALDKLVDAGYAAYDADRRATITKQGVAAVYILGWKQAQLRRSRPVDRDDDIDDWSVPVEE